MDLVVMLASDKVPNIRVASARAIVSIVGLGTEHHSTIYALFPPTSFVVSLAASDFGP